MSDQEIGKKEEERNALNLFLEAYEFTTQVSLQVVADGEPPDFICRRPEGALVGIEFTKVMVRPDVCTELLIPGNRAGLEPYEASEAIYATIEEKDAKRQGPDWRLPDPAILVIQVMDTGVEELEAFFRDADIKDDFKGFGFKEIWIANHASVEAYRGVTLFGLFPDEWWGPHERWNQWEKPYG